VVAVATHGLTSAYALKHSCLIMTQSTGTNHVSITATSSSSLRAAMGG